MRTKLTFILSAFFLTTSSFAAPPLFSGFYAGIGGGWMNTDVHDKGTFTVNSETIENGTDITNTNNRIYTLTSREDNNAFTGGLNFGYAYSIYEKYMVALEARANLEKLNVNFESGRVSSNLSATNPNVINFNNEVKLNNDFAFLLKFGIHPSSLNNVLLYSVIGPSWGNFNVSDEYIFSSQFQTLVQSNENASYKIGILAGIGIEYAFYKDVGLAFEFTHTDYGKLPVDELSQSVATSIDVNTDLLTATNYNNTVYAKTNNFVFKINYYF